MVLSLSLLAEGGKGHREGSSASVQNIQNGLAQLMLVHTHGRGLSVEPHALCVHLHRATCTPLFTFGRRAWIVQTLASQLLPDSNGLVNTLLLLLLFSRSVMSNSLRPRGLQLPGSSVRGIFQARVLEWTEHLSQSVTSVLESGQSMVSVSNCPPEEDLGTYCLGKVSLI